MTARNIVESLVQKGMIPAEFAEIAAAELHQELIRRARRTSQILAMFASRQQVAIKLAELFA